MHAGKIVTHTKNKKLSLYITKKGDGGGACIQASLERELLNWLHREVSVLACTAYKLEDSYFSSIDTLNHPQPA